MIYSLHSLDHDRSRILEEALSADLLTMLKRTNTSPNADQTKHCRYHRNFGYTTEDCWALKDKIKELVQEGHLRRFVQGNQEDRGPRVDERRTNRKIIEEGMAKKTGNHTVAERADLYMA